MKRTPTRAEGGITDKEKSLMMQISKKWTDIAFQTGSVDHEKIKSSIKNLYKVSGLKEPRVVIVPSPLVMAYTYGLAAGWWSIVDAATHAATIAATIAATYDATYDATIAATDDATYDATHAATYAATYDATIAATIAATDDATASKKNKWIYLLAITFANGNKSKAKLMINCISKWNSVYQGGNMWASFASYAEAMRDVIGLKGLDCWKKYQAWEEALKFSGFRVMHEKFCIVSEFPEILVRPVNNRLHCENGPTHRWKDGFEIYHLNGVRVPKELVMTDTGKLDPEQWLRHDNADVRAEFIRKFGIERLKSKGTVIDSYKNYNDEWYTKSKYELVDMSPLFTSLRSAPYLSMLNQSVPGMFHMEAVPKTVTNLQEALEFRFKSKNFKIVNIK